MKDTTLPVVSEKTRFIKAIENGENVVFTAPTGSGKSTCLPLWLFQSLGGLILVVEPRRVACKSLATWVAQQLGESVGKTVGYRIRFDDCTSSETRIFYVTPGVAVKMLKELTTTFSALMIDEFHERRWESDFIAAGFLAQQRLVDSNRKKAIPLVITSATLDGGGLANLICATHIDGKGSLYPVEITYDESIMSPGMRDLDHRVLEAVVKTHKNESDSGDILVFLPGMGEINDCLSLLSGHNLKVDNGERRRLADLVDIFVLHGSVDVSKLSSMLKAHSGKRRVFLSTNIAETSLTIPGVTTVIDSGLVRIRCHRAGRSGLVVAPICQDSMIQRSGRAGRVSKGRAIRLWSQTFKGEEQTAPEVERVYLDDMILSALSLGGTTFDVRNLDWITCPPDFAFDKSVTTLRRIGAIGGDDTISFFGRQLHSLPLPVELARLLTNVPPKLDSFMADIIALLSNRSRLLLPLSNLPHQRQTEVTKARKELFINSFDEVMMKVTCLRLGDSRKHHLSHFTMKMLRKSAAELRFFTGCKIKDPKGDDSLLPSNEKIAAFILKLWPESGFVLRRRALHKRQQYRGKGDPLPDRSEPWSNGETELSCRPHSQWIGHISAGKKCSIPVAGLILEHEWVGKNGMSVNGYGRMILPCSVETLALAGCGHEEVSEVSICKDGRVMAQVKRNYGGVTIESCERLLYGSALIRAVAGLAGEGRLFKGLLIPLKKSLFYIYLASMWPGGFGKNAFPQLSISPSRDFSNVTEFSEQTEREAAVSGISSYIEYCLSELGLKEPDDLLLLDNDCFAPSVELLSGLSFEELSDLESQFPSIWSYSGKDFEVQVSPLKRRVDLVPLNKEAKKTTELPRLVIPSFSGFSVFVMKGTQSRRVR